MSTQQTLGIVPNDRERQLAQRIERIRADVADILGDAGRALARGDVRDAVSWLAFAQFNRRGQLHAQQLLDHPERDPRNPRFGAAS